MRLSYDEWHLLEYAFTRATHAVKERIIYLEGLGPDSAKLTVSLMFEYDQLEKLKALKEKIADADRNDS